MNSYIKRWYFTLLLLTSLLPFPSQTAAEMSPLVYAEMQNEAPEKLQVTVLDVSESVSPDSEQRLAEWDGKGIPEQNIYFRVNVRAKVTEVTQSESGLVPGDEIEILYSRIKYDAGMVGPSSLPLLVAGQNSPAFLREAGSPGQYMTAARGWSFDPVFRPNMGIGMVLSRIQFDFDSAKLTRKARGILQKNAIVLRMDPDLKLKVIGHTDERGSDEYNLSLGERRANIARVYLISLGISKDRLQPISYSEIAPLDSNQNEAAWARNRRVEFTRWE